jgi:peptidoglycan/LPS O-acetylase OafA/YrhL
VRGERTGSERAVRTDRFPCFDGLRAIAAVSILVLHFAGSSGVPLNPAHIYEYLFRLNLGVAVFFVISGFLLYRPFAVAHFGGRPALPYREFMRRRLLRLVPAYWLIITVLILVGEIDNIHGWGIPAVYGFVHIYFREYQLAGLLQSWSLCTELAFYLLLPGYAWLLARRRRRAGAQLQAELLALVVLFVTSFVFIGALGLFDPFPGLPARVWLPAKLDYFALGMFLAVVSAWRSERPGPHPVTTALGSPRVAVASWGIAAFLYWYLVEHVGVPFGLTKMEALLQTEFLEGLIAFFIVFPAVVGGHRGGAVRSLLRSRPFQFAGLISYGIYLWHLEVISLVFRWTGGVPNGLIRYRWPDGRPPHLLMLAAVVALTFTIAALSYFLVEQRFLRLKSRRRPGSAPPPAGAPVPRPLHVAALSSGHGPVDGSHTAHPPNGAELGERARPLGPGP